MAAYIEIDNVHFNYGNRPIIRGITFSVAKGSFCSVLGPNGSGKTTLLGLLTGKMPPWAGNIRLNGKELGQYSLKELAKTISVVPQNMNIRFPFTCLEVVMMGRAPYKNRLKSLTDKDYTVAREAMEQTDTLDFADRLITELSGGERQRVIFAKALAQQPETLFLDEAFSNMDIYYSLKCLNLLKKLCSQNGLTVVSILHDLNLASVFCSETALLSMGTLVRYGPTGQVLTPELIQEIFKIQTVRAGEKGLAVLS